MPPATFSARVKAAFCNRRTASHPAGDTFTKTVEIKRIRNTSDNERSTYDFTCRITNQRGKVCMVCDRATMFPFFAPPSPSEETPPPEQPLKAADRLRDHVVKQSEKLGESGRTHVAYVVCACRRLFGDCPLWA